MASVQAGQGVSVPIRALCANCGHRWDAGARMGTDTPCPACTEAMSRPDVVWFGEIPYHMERIGTLLEDAGLFVAIGTSGTVYPAAGFVAEARAQGTRTLELTLDPSEVSHLFEHARTGPATRTVPQWVAELLGS